VLWQGLCGFCFLTLSGEARTAVGGLSSANICFVMLLDFENTKTALEGASMAQRQIDTARGNVVALRLAICYIRGCFGLVCGLLHSRLLCAIMLKIA
jgi:hypothetical protein